MACRRVVFRYLVNRHLRRERVFRDRTNPLDIYDDVDFFSRYRFRRADIIDICDVISVDIDHPVQRRGSLPPVSQLMIALQFYATGSMQIVVGDLFGVSKRTAGRVINRVSKALARRLNEYVRLPDQRKADRGKDAFYAIANFPNVLGCIDCTHVKIVGPSSAHYNQQEYVNRKGKHSINVQLICDADLLIINCVVKWPGSVHDSRILRESIIFTMFENIPRPLNGLFLGDSGYMLKDWLMTPFLNPTGRAQERFNASLCSTRSIIERTNGVLKRRWHCLHGELRYAPDKACQIITACIVLHNVAVTLGLPEPDSDHDLDSDDSESDLEDPDSDGSSSDEGNHGLQGRLARDMMVQRHFAR